MAIIKEDGTPMSDRGLADLYDNNKDGPEEWGGQPVRGPQRRERTLSGTLTVRFTADELAHIRRLAQERQVTYSEIVRLAVRAYTQPLLSFQQGTVTVLFGSGPTSGSAVQVQVPPSYHSNRANASITRAGW